MTDAQAGKEGQRKMGGHWGVAVHLADEQGFLHFTSPAFDLLFGYKPGSLKGKHLSILNNYSSQANDAKIKGIFEHLTIQGAWCGELFDRRANGHFISTHSRIFALPIGPHRCWLGVEEEWVKDGAMAGWTQFPVDPARIILN
ncbi:MAG: PAS domain S-box protein, partial [Deltaproteobacteria bacterium]|nr:PAS domain S-box protein [Deltaproteobacteria bacterium]